MLFVLCVCCAGCLSPRSVHPHQYPLLPDKHTDPVAFAEPDPQAGTWHSLRVSPNNAVTVTVWNRLNPLWWFGNADEPVAPSWYRPNGQMRTFIWHLRNPIHNFSHYVIGIENRESVRSGKYPRSLSNPEGGWNFAISKYKHLRLPCVDYRRGNFEFYLGWRVGGNFGAKFNWHDDTREKQPGKPPPPPETVGDKVAVPEAE